VESFGNELKTKANSGFGLRSKYVALTVDRSFGFKSGDK
jgi:hypothetical protein